MPQTIANGDLSLNVPAAATEPLYVPNVNNIIQQKNDISIPKIMEIWI